MTITTDDGTFKSRVHALFTGGDTPAIGDLIGVQHTGYFGCHTCTIHGIWGVKGGIYFPREGSEARIRERSSFKKGCSVRKTIVRLTVNILTDFEFRLVA